MFAAVSVIYTEDCTCEGEDFAEGGEDGGINHAQGRDYKGGQYQYGSKRSHTDC